MDLDATTQRALNVTLSFLETRLGSAGPVARGDEHRRGDRDGSHGAPSSLNPPGCTPKAAGAGPGGDPQALHGDGPTDEPLRPSHGRPAVRADASEGQRGAERADAAQARRGRSGLPPSSLGGGGAEPRGLVLQWKGRAPSEPDAAQAIIAALQAKSIGLAGLTDLATRCRFGEGRRSTSTIMVSHPALSELTFVANIVDEIAGQSNARKAKIHMPFGPVTVRAAYAEGLTLTSSSPPPPPPPPRRSKRARRVTSGDTRGATSGNDGRGAA